MMRVTFGAILGAMLRVRARPIARAFVFGWCYNLLWTGGGIAAGWWNGWYWRARMSPYNPNSTLYIHHTREAVSSLNEKLGSNLGYKRKWGTDYLQLEVVDFALVLGSSLVSLADVQLCKKPLCIITSNYIIHSISLKIFILLYLSICSCVISSASCISRDVFLTNSGSQYAARPCSASTYT